MADPTASSATDTAASGTIANSRVGAQLPADLMLTPLTKDGLGQARSVMEFLTTFHLASVVLDPYTNESSWVLRPAMRVLQQFRGCDARINFIVTADANDTRAFLGPVIDDFLVFCDPDRAAVTAMGLTELPAFAFIRCDGVLAACAQGWDPAQWQTVADAIAEITWWKSVDVPAPGEPGPFRGSPALG